MNQLYYILAKEFQNYLLNCMPIIKDECFYIPNERNEQCVTFYHTLSIPRSYHS